MLPIVFLKRRQGPRARGSTYVGLLQRGKRVPTIQVAERIANALGRKLSSLI
jgi:hypothetical protein